MKLKYEDILEIVTEHDLEGLIRMGAPKDEYAMEAGIIYRSLKCLTYIPDIEYVKELVEFVFWRSFEVYVPDSDAQVEDLIIRDFYEWQRDVDKFSFEMTLDICKILK